MQHDLRLRIFWIVHLLMLGAFGLEMFTIFSAWLKAHVPGLPADASRLLKLRTVSGRLIRTLFSRRLWAALRALVLDGLLQQRLYRVSKRRWLTHALVFGPWLVLGIFSTVTGFVVEILPRFGLAPAEVASIPVLGHLYHADVWWVALTNEVFGLLVLVGMGLVIHRRYIKKDRQHRSGPADHMVIALLALVALSGFPTEVFRLLADYTTPAGVFAPDPSLIPAYKLPLPLYDVWGPQWAFAGYLSARAFSLLRWSPQTWQVFRQVAFWSHFAITTALLFLLPFTRFFHVLMGPVIVVWNSLPDANPASAVPRRRPVRGL